VGGIVAPVAEEVFFRGILFAAAYEIEKNLIVPITIHCLGNLAIFSLSLIG
jgi:membrane protease YdiL (CAAX protease family)